MPSRSITWLELHLFALNGPLDDAVQLVAAGVGHQNLHQEAVELRFGKRIGAFHLDRILRGHHEERELEFVRGGAAGDRAFLHRFEQRRLRFGRRAIDLVGEHEIGEDRAGLKDERLVAALVGLDDHAADDVAGHEIGRELDARILKMKGASERPQQGSLAEAGNAFQQHVTGRKAGR